MFIWLIERKKRWKMKVFYSKIVNKVTIDDLKILQGFEVIYEEWKHIYELCVCLVLELFNNFFIC